MSRKSTLASSGRGSLKGLQDSLNAKIAARGETPVVGTGLERFMPNVEPIYQSTGEYWGPRPNTEARSD